ncbi:MAG: mechanosensitive ion channel protein MscS [endosymbiont of Galathealinum brachiosum]|uniref:Small-conductance mechanosensitive channel n=1 Tax=endosymbiont of Galathealinum brachiosum TaxID=2200906 RepID=A0A370DDM8_9GAMM|nr:MAG: mechanosensitive ion channel protein MscS [endosymbiont of Galathealinum brachiosum]
MFDQLSADNLQKLIEIYVIPWGISGVQALIVFVIGKWLVTKLSMLVGKTLRHSKMDEMLVDFVESLMGWALMLVVIIAALSQLGIDTTSLIALLGAAGLAIGLALKDSLSNFAAGVMLLVFRPFRIKDYVSVAGVDGTVEKIHVFTTTILTPDNKENIIPNSAVYGGVITNYSAKETRRVDMVFGIGYGDDIKKAKEVLVDIVTSHEKTLSDPAPLVVVSELADSSVNFTVRAWSKTADYWAVYFDCQEQVKIAFDAANISIPYPQMDIHTDKVA